MPPKKELPAKERGLFKRLIQEYETKKYKLGLKTADTILKKFPEAGETLCMKGLILATMNQRAEGIELARKGVRHDIGSFLAWHCLGILCRMEKNWEEAVKCYGMALRIEGGNNVNLQREMSYLHMQQRNYPALIDVRLALLKLQPHLRLSWVGLAVAHHLAGSLDEALRIISGLTDTFRDTPPRSFELSEIHLYRAQILFELGRHADVVTFLQGPANKAVYDKKASKLLIARAYAAEGSSDKAAEELEQLLRWNAEDLGVIRDWLKAKGVETAPSSSDGVAKAATALRELSTKFPQSGAAKRVALVYLQGDDFRDQAETYISAALQKGVPSIFADIVALYVDDKKRIAVEEIVERRRMEWAPADDAGDQQEPSAYLWSLYFLAQHYSKAGDVERGLAYIDSAIAHSPTMPELHMMRARVLKRGGSLHSAASAMEDARLLDGQDRFLNCKAAKYLLRVDDVKGATEVVSLFTKPDAPSPTFDLIEMQAFWYMAEEADAHVRSGNLALALKRLTQIDRTFQEIYDDQLDFHSYCMRKLTLRSYIDMVRFEDQLRSHPAYFRAALSAVKLLCQLHDKPDGDSRAPGSNGHLTEEQRKDAKKAKKAELKAADDAKKAAAKSKDTKKTDEDDVPPPPPDEDPDGVQLLADTRKKPLEAAKIYLLTLQERAERRVETWLATFEVALRSNDWLVAARAVSHAHKLQSNHPQLHKQIVQLRRKVPDLTSAPEPVREAIGAVFASVLPAEVTLEAFTTAYLQSATSAAQKLGAAQALRALDRTAEAITLIQTLTHAESKTDLAAALAAREELRLLNAEASAREAFDAEARKRFPHADIFKAHDTLKSEEAERQAQRRFWEPAQQDASSYVD
ncbi:N-terminal acetyltransferase [Ceraceosorus bombacis]|uniref:N-terminal acetyltransferase n=1 Tax=Ceraceosorus bombacis TaxID=401625 RepID=A0A0P1BIS1_9BASI|nr:N-terminal acetyltransferase [Ceraceosorus bombacis]